MKLACLCVVLLSAFIVEISSEKSELEKVSMDVVKSLSEIILFPIAEFGGSSKGQSTLKELEAAFVEIVQKAKELENKAFKEYLSSLPPDVRDTHKKAIGYVSMMLSGAQMKIVKDAQMWTNKSFDSLPEDLQKQILDIGREVNETLKNFKKTLSEESEEDPK